MFHGLYNLLAERLSPGTVHWLGCGVHGLGLVSRSGLVGRLGNWLVNRLRGGLVGGLGGLVGGCGSRLVGRSRGRLIGGLGGRLVGGLGGDVGRPVVGRGGLGLVHRLRGGGFVGSGIVGGLGRVLGLSLVPVDTILSKE